jgi:hypothetical protein
MKDVVSNRATSLVRWASLISIVGAAFNPYGLPWPVLAWASLGVAAMGLLAYRSNLPMSAAAREQKAAPLVPRPGEARSR